nr:sigma-70 family RNA polymerase sigma factor [Robertkochia marina]
MIKEHIQNAKKGNQKSFSFLLNTFWSNVYSFQLLRTKDENEAEDITIRTFTRAFDKIDSFDESYEFKTWLITISKNIHIDLLRKQKSRALHQTQHEEESGLYDLADDTPTAEDQLIKEQNLASLLEDIKKLKPHYQKVINLRYFQERSYQEIANELNEPLNSIKVKLLRARKLLAELISQKN